MNNGKQTSFIVLGNGFSINLIEYLHKEDRIDLVNLFSQGDKVPYPVKMQDCFLSKKYCPDLWVLGASPTNTKDEASNLINNIITSMNAHSLYGNDEERIKGIKDTCYYKAYCQLVSYLKNLFIYYNALISDEELLDFAKKSKFITFIQKNISNYNFRIITYNYDIFLERLLDINNMRFKIAGFESVNDNDSIVLYKPHGSISFETVMPFDQRQYTVNRDPFDGARTDISKMKVAKKVLCDKSRINPIIPPAGDATRFNSGWHHKIEEALAYCLKDADENDNLIIYGISYGHVDRNEIDRILTSLPYKIDVKNINPFPSETFEMVLGSIFENYSQYKDFYGGAI